ncbi:ExeA family protein [Aurantivibrio plasticivorans]
MEHFGFEVEPFEIAPNSEFLYLSRGHKKAFTYLNYALWNKDTFTLLTGDIGSGKTILLQHLLKTMPASAEVVTLYQTQLSPYELLYVIAEQLGLVSGEQVPKPKLFQLINDYILDSQKNVVLVIDEAQRFSRETLEELRLLAGIDLLKSKTNINIILCGQPELKQIVESGTLEQLNQRIKLRFHLTPLDYNETKEYVSFRVKKAGQKLEIFTQDAVKKIYELTNGLPRLINVLADTALTCGYADGFYAISSKQVSEAETELGWDTQPPRLSREEARKGNNNIVELQRSPQESAVRNDQLESTLGAIEKHLADIANSLREMSSREDVGSPGKEVNR